MKTRSCQVANTLFVINLAIAPGRTTPVAPPHKGVNMYGAYFCISNQNSPAYLENNSYSLVLKNDPSFDILVSLPPCVIPCDKGITHRHSIQQLTHLYSIDLIQLNMKVSLATLLLSISILVRMHVNTNKF